MELEITSVYRNMSDENWERGRMEREHTHTRKLILYGLVVGKDSEEDSV